MNGEEADRQATEPLRKRPSCDGIVTHRHSSEKDSGIAHLLRPGSL